MFVWAQGDGLGLAEGAMDTPGCLFLIGGLRELALRALQQPSPNLLSSEYLRCVLQGARGFPGTPGLPGVKGHRVSIMGQDVGRQELPGEQTFWGYAHCFLCGLPDV